MKTTEVKVKCPICNWKGIDGDVVADMDGLLACPKCFCVLVVTEAKIKNGQVIKQQAGTQAVMELLSNQQLPASLNLKGREMTDRDRIKYFVEQWLWTSKKRKSATYQAEQVEETNNQTLCGKVGGLCHGGPAWE